MANGSIRVRNDRAARKSASGFLCSSQATQTFSRPRVCSRGLFHTSDQRAAARQPLAEQIGGPDPLSTGPVCQPSARDTQRRPTDGTPWTFPATSAPDAADRRIELSDLPIPRRGRRRSRRIRITPPLMWDAELTRTFRIRLPALRFGARRGTRPPDRRCRRPATSSRRDSCCAPVPAARTYRPHGA